MLGRPPLPPPPQPSGLCAPPSTPARIHPLRFASPPPARRAALTTAASRVDFAASLFARRVRQPALQRPPPRANSPPPPPPLVDIFAVVRSFSCSNSHCRPPCPHTRPPRRRRHQLVRWFAVAPPPPRPDRTRRLCTAPAMCSSDGSRRRTGSPAAPLTAVPG